jgi:hypothetical protein
MYDLEVWKDKDKNISLRLPCPFKGVQSLVQRIKSPSGELPDLIWFY